MVLARGLGIHDSYSIEPSLAWGLRIVLLYTLKLEGRSRIELKDVWFTS
jgi:hypothetical protein